MRRPGRASGATTVSRILVLFVLVSMLLVSPGVAHAERTIALSSGSFSFEVAPGESGEGEVIVMNDGDEPLKALVYVVDVNIDDAGQQSFEVPQRGGASILTTPATWFRIFMPADSKSVGNTPYLEMDPGERIPIKFEFSAPQGTPSGDHNVVIFFEMFELTQGVDGAAAQVSGRLGTRIALRVAGEIVEQLSIRPFEVPAFRIGNTVPFTFTLNNGGNTNKRVAVTAELLDASERTVAASVVASDTAVFADSRYRFDGVLNTGAGRFGLHTVEVKAIYLLEGAATPTELIEQRTVWLVPLWAVLLAGFIVFDLLMYAALRVWRGRSRGPARGRPTDARASIPASAADPGAEDPPVAPDPDAREVVHPAGAGDSASNLRSRGVSRRQTGRTRMSRSELQAEAEERRRRREARAAENAVYGDMRGGLTETAEGGADPRDDTVR